MAERSATAPASRPSVSRLRVRAGRPLVCCLLAPLLVAMACVAVAADNGQIAQEQDKLQQLRSRIDSLKGELESVRGQRDAQQAALERTDRAIGEITAEVRKLDAQTASLRQELVRLEADRDVARQRLERMHSMLVRELRSAYRNGRQERIKLLLNQDDPARVARMLTYQGYFARARGRRMDEYRATLAQLQASEQTLGERQSELAVLRAEREQQMAGLGAEQARQADILDGLKQRLASGTAELGTLEADAARVNKLLESLRKALRDIPADSGLPLARLKGKLEWPVAGRISMPYGAQQAAGKMRARGVHITADAGADVRAIARGRVVFADWLRGFGLLMILDHGDGYMSLYGENSSLYKGVGERVGRGEAIAAAGNSGGQLRTGLYLELRKDGQPLDPAGWFKGKPEAQRAARNGSGGG